MKRALPYAEGTHYLAGKIDGKGYFSDKID